MQRLIARLLLLFALAGTFVPVALAMTAPPLHACCIRKAHHCHESASADSAQLTGAKSCCTHDGGRAVTTSQWANPQPGIAAVFAGIVAPHVLESHSRIPFMQLSASQSPRAPPIC